MIIRLIILALLALSFCSCTNDVNKRIKLHPQHVDSSLWGGEEMVVPKAEFYDTSAVVLLVSHSKIGKLCKVDGRKTFISNTFSVPGYEVVVRNGFRQGITVKWLDKNMKILNTNYTVWDSRTKSGDY